MASVFPETRLTAGRRCLDGVIAYVALCGYAREAGAAFCANRTAWLLDVELRWVMVRQRLGKNKMTRLHWACATGRLARVKELLDFKSDPNAGDIEGLTPLHYASFGGHVEVVRYLLAAGAAIEASGRDKMTALHTASYNGHAEVVRLLLDSRAEIEAECKSKCTPLYHASRAGHLEIVQMLLVRGAAVNTRSSGAPWLPVAESTGSTALHIASFEGHSAVARELLAAGAEIAATCSNGCTPLYWASQSGALEVVRGQKPRLWPCATTVAAPRSTSRHLAFPFPTHHPLWRYYAGPL